MSRLAFLSPDEAEVAGVSPLRHVLGPAFTDVSHLGKLEVRGDVDAARRDPARPRPRRSWLWSATCSCERDRLVDLGYRVYDMTAALAALEVEGEDLMRRLTELDLDALPAIGCDRARNDGVDRAARGRALPALRSAGARPVRRRGRDRHGAGARAMKDVFRVRRMWRPRSELKKRYDVVIIGGGSHGLATAYYLAKNHGVKTSPCSSSRTSARVRPGATRPSSAPTTARPRARRSTRRACSCTSSCPRSSTST